MAKEGFVSIHGKEYKTVAKRVQEFRENPAFNGWTIMTDIVKLDDDMCVMRASILSKATDGEAQIIATGHGCEFKTSSQINKTSYVENCETSAIGRALAALGLGGTEFASANEVQNAIYQQNNPVKPTSVKATDGAMENLDEESQQFIRDFAIEIIAEMDEGNTNHAYDKLQSLDNDEKTAIWTLLDSKIRSALKKYAESLKG